MKITYSNLDKLSKEHGNGFYILDEKKLHENYMNLYNAFQSRYENFLIGYSYKTNYVPYLCHLISKYGGYAEVVSRMEYDIALKVGVSPDHIIFNGPIKSYDDLEMAIRNNSLINIDSDYEINYIKSIAAAQDRNEEIKVGLRVNFNLFEGEKNQFIQGYDVSRFGLCYENGDLENAINRLKDINNVKIIGLHGHFSTKERRVSTYEIITKKLCDIGKTFFPDTLEYIDIGGGMYGELPKELKRNEPPSINDYAGAICSIMNAEFPEDHRPLLIVEPGTSIVANVFEFFAKVIDIKNVRNEKFVLVDGSVVNIKPTMHPFNLPYKFVTKEQREEVGRYHIVGYTLMESDYLSENIEDVVPHVGDFVGYTNVGAYTIVLNGPFIKERPAILSFDGSNYKVIRKKESIDEFVNPSIYMFKD
jgi:diaminopimelate decarboxylase